MEGVLGGGSRRYKKKEEDGDLLCCSANQKEDDRSLPEKVAAWHGCRRRVEEGAMMVWLLADRT
jgi:hypothetical protein